MSPSNTQNGQPLTGIDAELAGLRLSRLVDGGVAQSVGIHTPPKQAAPDESEAQPDAEMSEAPGPFAGLGPFLEDEPADVFKEVHQLVRRQEPLARNRLAMDEYYTACKNGHGLYFKLEKVQDQSIYRCEMFPGANALVTSAVPNMLADSCRSVIETLLADPPTPAAQAEDDSEESERAVEMAEEFLAQDGGEAGTRDTRFFWMALDAATSKSAAFGHYWVDATGNGSIAHQIKAHPLAVDPANPTIGPDGQTTTDMVLRYVTPEGPNGEPSQFTEDPSKADREWVPKICIDFRGREHVRCYPETADVNSAEMVILLDFCTLDEGKRRWKDTVGQMDDSDLSALCDWTPSRYLRLLPPALRARWKLADGDAGKDAKGSSNDQRIMFFYMVYRRQTPTYPKGCALAISGMEEGTILGKDTLTADVPLPNGKGTNTKDLDIPVSQWELVLDADDRDPMAKPLAARIDGPNRAMSKMAGGYVQALDLNLNPATFTPSTSPVLKQDVDTSRATGQHIPILTKEDQPFYEPARVIPTNITNVIEWTYEQMRASVGTSKASMGADKQQEVSGVARNIAVQQTNVALSPMQQGIASSAERHWRIKLQMAMKFFTGPQMIRYVGEDGAYKQEWFNGVDFARVTGVKVQGGTNTMMSPQAKVSYVQQMERYIGPDDAADVMRPAFAGAIGLPADPQQQRIERQVSSWLKGPPSPQWIQQAQAYNQAKAVADQQNQQATQGYQAQVAPIKAQQQADQANASALKVPVSAAQPLPPPPTPVQRMDANGQPMASPWTPFAPLPMDDEPMIAALRQRRLKTLMAKTRFTAQPPEWQQMVVVEYNRMRAAVAAVAPFPALPKGVNVDVKATPTTVGQAELAASHPNSPQPQAA